MPRQTLPCLLSLLVVYGCSASTPTDESPSGGIDGPGSPTLHHYVLMGSTASEY